MMLSVFKLIIILIGFGRTHQSLIQPVRGTVNIPDKDLKSTVDTLMAQLNRFEENQEQKLATILSVVRNSDANVKALQEKAQFFEIYRHHISHWSEHMKSMDQKIELLRRGQDQLLAQEAKLSHLDFKVQHIFDKVDVLNEKLHDITKKLYAHSHRQRPITAGLVEMDASTEILSRLATLQRHVQNSCRPISVEAKNPSTTTVQQMMDKDDLFEVKEYLIRIWSQLEKIPVKDLKQVVGVNRKVNRHLESLTEMVRSVDERTIRIFDADAFQSRKMYSSCKNTEHEIRTFTNSADLLLKRIERLVLGLETKTGHLEPTRCGQENATVVDEEFDQPSKPEEGEYVPTNEASGDREDNIDEKSENVTPITDFDEGGSGDSTDNGSGDLDNDSESKEMAEEALDEEQNEFVQPQKSGCHQVTRSGVYKFGLDRDLNQGLRDFNERVCDFSTNDGIAWTVIQHRQPGEVQENFNRSWNEYKNGFGDLDKDFWYGNDFIHKLTYNDSMELRIELEDFEGNKKTIQFNLFQVAPEKQNYNLMVGGFVGKADEDSFMYHNDQDFSTFDRANDKSKDTCCPCALTYGSGWWFNNCSESNLNGRWFDTPTGHNFMGIIWEKWLGDYSLAKTRMLIRPKELWFNSEEDEAPMSPPDDP